MTPKFTIIKREHEVKNYLFDVMKKLMLLMTVSLLLALSACKDFSELTKLGDKSYWDALSYKWDEKYEEAARKLEVYVEKNPDDEDALYELGYCYFMADKYQKAIEAFTRYLNTESDFKIDIHKARYYRGRSYIGIGKFKEAVLDLRWDLMYGYTNYGWVNYELARAYCKLGLYEKALKEYERAIRENEFESDFYNGRACCCWDMQEKEKALADIDRAIILDHNSSRFHYNKAFFLEGYGRTDEALLHYSLAIKFDPKHCWAFRRRAHVWAELGHYDRAIKDMDKAIEIDPKDPDAYAEKSRLYSKLGEYELALKDIDKAIEIIEKTVGSDRQVYSEFHLERERIYKAIGKSAKGKEELQ